MDSESDNSQHAQCPSYCQTAYKGYTQQNKKQEYVGVRLSTHNMYDINMATYNIEEYCNWAEVTHLIVTCMGVSKGKPCLLDVHGRFLQSASTYMPHFVNLKAKFPHLLLVLSFDPVYYSSALPEALQKDPASFLGKLGGYMTVYGFDGVEINLKLFTITTSRDIELTMRQSVLYGRLYLTIGGDVDLSVSRNVAIMNLFGMFACCVIVNTFGFYQYKCLFLKNGMLQLLQPFSDRTVEHVRSILLTVLTGIPEQKIMLGFTNEALVFQCEGSVVKNVYETAQKEVELLKTDDEKVANLKKEGLVLAYDNHNDRITKLGMVKRYKLAGFVCGDLWHDLSPNATMSFLSVALRNM